MNIRNPKSPMLLLAVTLLVGLMSNGPAAIAMDASSQVHIHTCSKGYYKNSNGACTKSPTASISWPAGASAKCRDGSYSFSAHRSGTCSRHGGVAAWTK